MKVLRMLIAGAALALLAACAASIPAGSPTGTPTTPGTIGDQTQAVIKQVQDVATNVCRFVPTAATVAGIIATFTGGGGVSDTVTQVANAICAAVSSKSAVRGRPVRVNGVIVKGYRVGT